MMQMKIAEVSCHRIVDSWIPVLELVGSVGCGSESECLQRAGRLVKEGSARYSCPGGNRIPASNRVPGRSRIPAEKNRRLEGLAHRMDFALYTAAARSTSQLSPTSTPSTCLFALAPRLRSLACSEAPRRGSRALQFCLEPTLSRSAKLECLAEAACVQAPRRSASRSSNRPPCFAPCSYLPRMFHGPAVVRGTPQELRCCTADRVTNTLSLCEWLLGSQHLKQKRKLFPGPPPMDASWFPLPGSCTRGREPKMGPLSWLASRPGYGISTVFPFATTGAPPVR
ncbi:hypothetical protein O3P69_005248 [Scylla paramamosain]|uniref:Uncharacterized protein n=1 Tax=Scylla paramamosain TaxID=85552 RepID=A0AAW0U8F7_SCYPA